MELTQSITSTFQTFADLGWHYVFSATPFFILHVLLFVYFVNKWRRSRRYLRTDLDELRDELKTPTLLIGTEDTIKGYTGTGREFFVRGIEDSIIEKVDRHTEPLRLLVNSFIAVGLLGTLFALFGMAAPGNKFNPQDIVGRMSIAFSASFFGLLLTLICNLFLLRPLRIRVSEVSNEVRNRIKAISAKHQVSTPTQALHDAVEEMRKYVFGFHTVISRIEETDRNHVEMSRSLLVEFKETTISVLNNLTGNISRAQTAMAKSAEDLTLNVSEALNALETRFVSISENWKQDLHQTIESNERAASRLSVSSEALADTTKEVSTSLLSVKDALERTKHLSKIANDIERLTNGYLKQTEEQITLFHTTLNETAEATRTIPDEWFTMLQNRNDQLTETLTGITNTWKNDVIQIGNDFFTDFGKINSTLNAISNFLSPDGSLGVAVNELSMVAAFAQKNEEPRTGVSVESELTHLREVANRLVAATELLPQSQGMNSAMVQQMNSKVSKIHDLLSESAERSSQSILEDTQRRATVSPRPPEYDGITTKGVNKAEDIEHNDAEITTIVEPARSEPIVWHASNDTRRSKLTNWLKKTKMVTWFNRRKN